MKKLLSLLLVVVSLTSCHLLGPALSVVDSLVNDSAQVLKIVETTFNVYEADHAVSPEDRKTFQSLLSNAYLALNTATRALRGKDHLDQGEYDAAVADFTQAYANLKRFMGVKRVTPAGVGLVGSSLTADGFPEPALIGYHVQ